MEQLAVVILAAGRGSRLKSALPKVLHTVGGQPILTHILNCVQGLNPECCVVVTAPDMDSVRLVADGCLQAVQTEPRGSGDAARVGIDALKNFSGRVLILNGDMPLVTLQSLQALLEPKAKLSILTTQAPDPTGYGRVIEHNCLVQSIVEEKDASVEQRQITTINAGAYVAKCADLKIWLNTLKPNNAQGELYLTDIIQAGETMSVSVPFSDTMGVNTRAELAACEAEFQRRMRQKMLDLGVTLIDPSSVYFSADTVIEPDCIIHPQVHFLSGVVVKCNVTIKSFCHLEGCTIDENSSVGPFARIRSGTKIGKKVKIGNFIEIKNTTMADGVKAGHVGYLGDAELGAGTNVGAGVITANYDGTNKHKTVIGEDVMLGVHASLVAPINIGDFAYIAAGSTLTKDVDAGSLAVARAETKQIKNWTKKSKGK